MNLIDDVALPGSLWAIVFSMGLSLTWHDFQRVFNERRALLVVGIVVATKFVLVMRNVMAKHRREQVPLRQPEGDSRSSRFRTIS